MSDSNDYNRIILDDIVYNIWQNQNVPDNIIRVCR